jgi:hypothetical protein
VIKKGKGKKKEEVSGTKREAVKEAKESNAAVTIQGKHGRIQQRESFNPNRRAPTGVRVSGLEF